MNPIKLLGGAMPALKEVLESIHAYLEEQLKVQKEILKEVNEIKLKIDGDRDNKNICVSTPIDTPKICKTNDDKKESD